MRRRSWTMMMAALALALVLGVSCGADTGLKMGVNEAAVSYMTDTVLPVVLEAVQKVDISDISTEVSTPVGMVDMNVTDIKIESLSAGKITVKFVSPYNVKATMSGALMKATLGWAYREHAWPHTTDKGTGTITAKKVSATITMEIRMNATDGRPIVRAPKIKFKIGSLKIKLHGGASWLYNIFISVLKPIIVSNIDKAVKRELKYLLNTFVNEEFARFPVQIPLGLGIGFAYAMTADPTVASASLVFPSQGEFYPLETGPGHSGHTPVVLPDHATSKVNMFELIFSEFSAQTLGYSAFKAGAFEQRLTKEDAAAVPAASVLFTTDVYAVYAPRMLTKFGRGKETSLRFSAFREPLVDFTESGFDVTFPLIVTIDVNNTKKGANVTGDWEEAFALMVTANTKGDIGFDNNTLRGKIAITNTTIALHSSNVGAVNVKGLSSTIHIALDVAQTFVNKALANGIPIPAFHGLTFVDPIIEWYDKYVAVSSSGKYVPPTPTPKSP